MKRIYITVFAVLSLSVLLPLCCFAQGSVNSNNALGAPADQTNDPYTASPDTVLTDGTVMTDPPAVTTPDTVVTDSVTAAPDVTDTAAAAADDGNMTAVIVLIIAAVAIAAVIIIVLAAKKGRERQR